MHGTALTGFSWLEERIRELQERLEETIQVEHRGMKSGVKMTQSAKGYPRTHIKMSDRVELFVPALDWWKLAEVCGPLDNPPSLIGEVWAREKPCLNKQCGQHLRGEI